MKRIPITFLLLFVLASLRAQDVPTQSVQPSYRHEVGFNVMRLVDMLSFIEAPADQLPYDVFYNYYFNEKVGLRFGAGILKQNIQTEIPGQSKPRKSEVTDLNLRAGVTTNFLRAGAITVNGFADAIFKNFMNKSVTTTTMQTFGDPVITTTVKSQEKAIGFGGQVGLGLNWKVYKNLCLYTEVPLSFMAVDRTTRDEVSDDVGNFDVESQALNSAEIRITLPATVYLVLRF